MSNRMSFTYDYTIVKDDFVHIKYFINVKEFCMRVCINVCDNQDGTSIFCTV